MGKSCISLLYSRVYRLTHGMIWGTKLTVLHVLAGSYRFLQVLGFILGLPQTLFPRRVQLFDHILYPHIYIS